MPFYSEHRRVQAALAIERVGTMELEAGARQRRVELLERETREQNKTPRGVSFARVLEQRKGQPPDEF
jgi:hypothetical protein